MDRYGARTNGAPNAMSPASDRLSVTKNRLIIKREILTHRSSPTSLSRHRISRMNQGSTVIRPAPSAVACFDLWEIWGTAGRLVAAWTR